MIDGEINGMYSDNGDFSEGQEVNVQLEVENTGNEANEFFVGYSVHDPNGDVYDNNGSTGQTVYLSPGDSDILTLSWEVESDIPEGQYDAQVSLWEESDINNLQTRLDDKWDYSAFTVVEETEEIDAGIYSVSPDSGSYSTGNTVTTTVGVENTGTVDHTFYVGYTVHGPNDVAYDNSGSTGHTVQLESNGYDEVDVEWEVEEGASTGSYDVQVSVWEENNDDNLQTRLDDEWEYSAFSVEEEPEEIDAVIQSLVPDSGTFSGGDTVTTTVDLENSGTVEHTFYVGYTVHGPDGTEYDNSGTTGRTKQLQSGGQDEIHLEWEVGADVTPGEYNVQVSIWEESDRDNLQTRLADEWEYSAFTVEEGTKNIEAEINSVEPDMGSFSEGDRVTTTATVANNSSVEHTFFVGYSVHGPDGETYDNDAETGQTARVDPNDTQSVDLEWIVEEDAPEGEYDIQTAIWEEQDRNNLQTRLDEEWQNNVFSVRSREIHAEIGSVESPDKTYLKGDEVTTPVQVENLAEVGHTFFVGYTIHGPDGGTYDNDRSTGQAVAVPAEESRSVDLTWVIEKEAPVGEYDLQVAIWKEQDPDNLQTRLDNELADNAFSIREEEANAVINRIDPDEGTFSEGDLIQTTVLIENVGQAEHEFFIGYTVHGPEGASYSNNEQTGQAALLDSQESQTLELEWEVESEAKGGEYDVEVVVWKESDRDELTTQLDEARTESAFEIASKESLDYQVDVRDARGNPLTGTEVTLTAAADGSSRTQNSNSGTVTFSDVQAGEYRITATSSEVNQSKKVKVHAGDTATRHQIVFDPARPILGAALGGDGKYLSEDVEIEFSDIGETTTTNGLGLFKTSERVPFDDHELSVNPPNSASTNITLEHRLDNSALLDLDAAATVDADAYASSIVDENSFTSFVIQYAQSQKDYDSKTIAALHGFVKGLLTGFTDLIDGFKEIAEVVVALVTNLKRALKAILSTFIDALKNITDAFDYLVAAIRGIPDAYFDAVDDLVQKQEDDNPHLRQDDVYMPFALLWYGGYTITGLIIGGAFKRIGTAGRQVVQRMDVFEDATSVASRWVRRSGDPDEVSPDLIGTFNNANPNLGRRSGDLPLQGSFQDVGMIKETIESAPTPELVKEFVSSAYYRNHWMRGKHDAKDPAEDARDSRGQLSGNMKGNVNEELVAASLLKGFDTNRLVSKLRGLDIDDLQADYIWNSFQPTQLAKGESALIRGFEPNIQNGFELDFVRVVRPDTPDGEPSLPIVTHVIEPTSGRGNNIDVEKYRARKKDHLENKIPDQIDRLDRDFLPGTNLDLHSFLRDGNPELILVKTRDNPDTRFDVEIEVDHDELIDTADAIKTADEVGPTDKNLLDYLIQPPDADS